MSLKPLKSPSLLPRSRSVSPITVAERLRLEQRLEQLQREKIHLESKRNGEEDDEDDVKFADDSLRNRSASSPMIEEEEAAAAANNSSSRFSPADENDDSAAMGQDEPENLSKAETASGAADSPKGESPIIRDAAFKRQTAFFFSLSPGCSPKTSVAQPPWLKLSLHNIKMICKTNLAWAIRLTDESATG